MSPMSYNEELGNKINYIEDIIKSYLPKEDCLQQSIFEAMEYSILAGGKRLRPMLMLETYFLFGGNNSKLIEPFMAAIEMIHTYSLVHDDLPAMDNDEYRRGRKTTHIVYGEAMGILAGDGLLNFAFETASKAFDYADESNLVRIGKSFSVLSKKAGVYGMIGGQVIDIKGLTNTDDTKITEGEHNNIKNRLIYMYKLKTSALIEASMMIGAILAGATEVEISLIEAIASNIGIAFQVQDDILDVTSTVEILGKPTHSDEKNEKVTIASLIGVDNAKEEVKILSQKALDGFDQLNRKNEFLDELIMRLITREK